MKRTDENRTEHVESARGDAASPTVTVASGSDAQPGRDESVTILIEGGGFSFNDVFPMGSRALAAENGRAIATFALSLVSPRRRRSSGRNSEE